MTSSVPVLVVGHEDHARAAVSATLRRAGYEAVEAKTGRVALDLLLDETRREPCAIVLDAEMPEMAGYELVTTLSGHRRLAVIPIIVLSIEDDPDEGAHRGAVAEYLRKPHDPAQLTAIVKTFARHHT